MFYAIIVDDNGNGIGCHTYAEEPDSYPDNEYPCTQADASNSLLWSVVNGKLVQALAPTQAAQIATLTAAYNATIASLSATYTSQGGVTKAYQGDPGSISNLAMMLNAFAGTKAVPTGFYWVSSDNTQVPFTYTDLQNLANLLGVAGNTAFQQLQTLKAQVNAATTVAEVQAVTWQAT